MKSKLLSWKYPCLLLFGIGTSNIGDWIYLIALNVMMLDMTNSPLAISGLYMIKPLAALCTNIWSGSLIDRMNKRKLMMVLDWMRAGVIACLPLFSSILIIYVLVFIISMAGSMFRPVSMVYITKLIPTEKRKRFNSLRSLIDSGGFLLGPAAAGALFMIGTPAFAIYANAAALVLSGVVTLFMPNLDTKTEVKENKLSVNTIREDWKAVFRFSRANRYIITIHVLFSFLMVMATAIDSLEVSFATKVIRLSESEYGFLVSVAGAGIMIGAVVNTLFAKKLSTNFLIGAGSVGVSLGYLLYACSSSFQTIGAGFFSLSFALAFASAGFQTFYQNSIPVDMMGRVGSIYGLLESLLIIMMTFLCGMAAHIVSIQGAVIGGSLIMLLSTVVLFLCTLKPAFYKISLVKKQGI
ncbi:MFS transporter [Priestia aryabhattai]|uniref:MFS transporter n=1 Tax=Priestia aryabhattai TaxID=412384 RepID=UPI0008DD4FD0|nr:MFS transporter [Priestia aryabhattai]MBZ6487375.1 MFS transporter [Priestia aryabhattai]MDH3114228.1 MFS transporter [Priestia aryabhattai]MDH3126873.1 MFS transporter [Priestia aryabhattai]MDH3132885.1 MFS transporter [Priestia aryabhattai]MED4153730.1 MFS transporter [Priestia aryabhattai]